MYDLIGMVGVGVGKKDLKTCVSDKKGFCI
jgi:hypothetical protein